VATLEGEAARVLFGRQHRSNGGLSLVIWMARGLLAAGRPVVGVALVAATPMSRPGGFVLVRQPFPWVRFALASCMTRVRIRAKDVCFSAGHGDAFRCHYPLISGPLS
jgi:hypothetical protein